MSDFKKQIEKAREEALNYAMLYAESSPRPATYTNAFMKCWDKFVKPLMEANDSTTSENILNISDVSSQKELLVEFARFIQKNKNNGLDFDCVEREVDSFLNQQLLTVGI